MFSDNSIWRTTSKFWQNLLFTGKVGEDKFEHMLVDILKENNVDHRWMRFDAGARTDLAFVTLGADAERGYVLPESQC